MSPLPTPPSQDSVHSGDGVVFSTSLNGIQILALPQHLCLSCPVYGVRAELLPDLYGQFPFGSSSEPGSCAHVLLPLLEACAWGRDEGSHRLSP